MLSWLRKLHCKPDKQCGEREVGEPKIPSDEQIEEFEVLLTPKTMPYGNKEERKIIRCKAPAL